MMIKESAKTGGCIAKSGKALGIAGGLLTAGSNIWGNVNYFKYGANSPNAVSPWRTAVDAGFLYIGMRGGWPGALAGTAYAIASPVIWAPTGVPIPIASPVTVDATYVAPR